MELGIASAAKKFKVSKQALVLAVRRGALPALVVQTTELRLKPKDVAAYVATIPDWRRAAGRKGGLLKMARWRANQARTKAS